MHESFSLGREIMSREKYRDMKNPYVELENLRSLCEQDEDLKILFDQMIENCKRYAETVFRFEQIVLASKKPDDTSSDDRAEIEKIRTTIHDATIDSINILARNFAQKGNDSSWVKKLSSGGRPSYGKFALTVSIECVINELETVPA